MDTAADGSPAHGPAHLLITSGAEIGFYLGLRARGLVTDRFTPRCARLLVPSSTSEVPFSLFGKNLLLLHSVSAKVLGELQFSTRSATAADLVSLERERDKHQIKSNVVFCDQPDGDGHLFWEYSFHLDRSRWPRSLLWHGWLLGLACRAGDSCWVTTLLYLDLTGLHSASQRIWSF